MKKTLPPCLCLAALALLVLPTHAFCPRQSAPSRPHQERRPHIQPTMTAAAGNSNAIGKVLATCGLLLVGGPSLAGAVAPAAPPAVLTATTTLTVAASGGASGLQVLNDFLLSVKAVKSEIASDQVTDLARIQKAFDVTAVKEAVDGLLDLQMSNTNQNQIISKRKVIDKVLRAVFSDVITVEDTLRDYPERTGLARLKKVQKPMTRLENDLSRLTAALTSEEEDVAGAAKLVKPLFSLCANGFLICAPQ